MILPKNILYDNFKGQVFLHDLLHRILRKGIYGLEIDVTFQLVQEYPIQFAHALREVVQVGCPPTVDGFHTEDQLFVRARICVR